MHFLLALLIGVMAFCGYLIFDGIMLQKKRRDSLLSRIGNEEMPIDTDGEAEITGEPSAAAKQMLLLLRLLGVNVEETKRKMQARLIRAGINSPDAGIYYLFFERIISIFIIVYMLSSVMKDSSMENLMMAGIVIFMAVMGPKLYVNNKIEHRKKKLKRAFPDTLDLLLICVESGLALDAALSRVCQELGKAYPEMSEELNRTRLELTLLNDRIRALNNLSERTDMVQFRSLNASLIQSERFGTSLSDTLRVLAEDFRLERMADAEAKAARLPVLLTIPLIFLLMPSFMLIVLGPAIANVMAMKR